jgi:hypothetical protein
VASGLVAAGHRRAWPRALARELVAHIEVSIAHTGGGPDEHHVERAVESTNWDTTSEPKPRTLLCTLNVSMVILALRTRLRHDSRR